MRIITLLCVLVCSACAVETIDEPPTEENDNSTDYPTYTSGPGGGGIHCSRPIYIKLKNGMTYYEPGMCPIPRLQRPEPDPAGIIDKRKDLISPEKLPDLIHENH